MPLAGVAAASAVLLLVLGASPSCHGASTHNITDILAKRSDFTEFSAALSSTGAAAAIDDHQTVTVLAVNNTVMAQLRALQLQPSDLQRVIYLQVLFDYFDATKLRSIVQESTIHVTSLYQASGKAQGSAGMEDVTVLRGGRVAFSLSDRPSNAPPPVASFYEKSILETPYDIAVLQVSALIGSPAPVVAPPPPPTVPLAPAPASSPAHAAAASAPAPVSSPPAPASSPAHAAAAPAPAPVSSPPAPVVAPATPPTPRRRPAPSPEDTPAPAPDADDSQPPADQNNDGARDTTPWNLGAAALAAAIVSLLW